MAIELRHSQDRLEGLQDDSGDLRGRDHAGAGCEPRRLGRRDVLRRRIPGGVRSRSSTAVRISFRRRSDIRDWSEHQLSMASYISSNANRFYTALESSYGSVASNHGEQPDSGVEADGASATRTSRTGKTRQAAARFAGLPAGGRRRTNFELRTYLTSWQKSAGGPGYGPLFQAALGGAPLTFRRRDGGLVHNGRQAGIQRLPHGLVAGQAVASGGEIRFVAAIVDANTVQLNVPFTALPAAGAALSAAVTYVPATDCRASSVFDYWSPATAVQRLLCGAAVDQMEIVVNGDYHEFHFSGHGAGCGGQQQFFGSGGVSCRAFRRSQRSGHSTIRSCRAIWGKRGWALRQPQFFTITMRVDC